MGGHLGNFPPKVKNIFDFAFSLYLNQLEEWRGDKFLHISSSSRFFSPSPFSSSSNFSFAGISATSHLFLLSRRVSCIFTLVFMLSLDGCWWGLFKSLEMFYGHEYMFNWDGISRFEAVFWYVWKNREVQKTEHLEHAWVSNFLGLIQMCLHFFWYFL